MEMMVAECLIFSSAKYVETSSAWEEGGKNYGSEDSHVTAGPQILHSILRNSTPLFYNRGDSLRRAHILTSNPCIHTSLSVEKT